MYQTFTQAGVAVRTVVVVGKEIRLTLPDGSEHDEKDAEESEGLGGVKWSKS